MLGKNYVYYKDCCGSLVTKQEMTKIRLETIAGVQNQTMQAISPEQNAKGMYHTGSLYANTYVNYCLCFNCFRTFAYEVELNNERVTEAKVPFFCPCYGPYPVEGRNGVPMGEYAPHCYILKLCGIDWAFPCCLSLSIHDKNINEIYMIKRRCCTCFCCTKWDVFDMLNNQKAEIAQTGIVCPQFEVTLPQDNENNKALVLGTIAMLP